MKKRFAYWLSTKLASTRGSRRAGPGAWRFFTHKSVAGDSLSVLSVGDTFEVYQGREQIYAFNVPNEVAGQIARYYFQWWVLGTWCGLRSALWRWCLRVLHAHAE